MAPSCLSPSPSGRRLSELLEEKQEPFVLDLHLLERGCSSSRLLDTTAALCWPSAAGAGNDGAAAAVLRRLTSGKKKATTKSGGRGGGSKQKQPAGGLLQLLLSKILGCSSGKKPAALHFSDSFKLPATAATTNPAAVAPAPAPCSSDDRRPHLDAVKTAADVTAERHDDGSDEDEEEEKQQLSPVSVLDHPFETESSPPSKAAAAMDVVFRDLLDAAAFSPALLAQLLAKSDDLLLMDATAAADDDDDCCYYGGNSPSNCRSDESSSAAAAYWDAHREELARVTELVAAELPTSKLVAADVAPERRDVGAEVEAAVFEALLRELVVDIRSCF